MQKHQIKKCFRCGQEIYFDAIMKSQKGKFIPLDPITNQPHNCPQSKFKPRGKTVGEEILDLEQRENERVQRIRYD